MLSPTSSPGSATPWQSAAPSSSDCSVANLSGACALMVLMAQSQSTAASSSKTDLSLDWDKMQELKKQLADALQQAKDAASHSGFLGFLGNIFGGDIAEIVGAVAAVAAVVATAGAATAPLAVLLLSEGLQAAAKLGPELGLDPKICMALGIAAAAVGFMSGSGAAQAAGTLADAARGVELGAHVAEAGATATGGVLNFGSAQYHAKSLDLQADASGYQSANDATSLDFDDALSLLQRALQTQQHETQTISGTIQSDNDSNVALSARI
jgi:hypothetical protein